MSRMAHGCVVGVMAVWAVCFALAPNAAAQAVTSAWSSAVSGAWNDDAKWDKGVPLAGTNALIGAGGSSFAVDFTTPVSYKIGALLIANTSGNTTTLNINTNGFRFGDNSSYLKYATLSVNAGGVVTNTGTFCGFSTAGATLAVNGGTYVQTTGDFGNSANGPASIALQMNSGTFNLNLGTSGHFYSGFTMTGGVVQLTGTGWASPFTSTLSGGVFSNSTAQFGPRNGSMLTLTNQGQLVSNGFYINGNGENLRVDGGVMQVTGTRFEIGNNTFTGAKSGSMVQTAGTVSMTSTVGLVVGMLTSGTTSGTYWYDLQGGILNLEKITLTAPGRNGTGTVDLYQMSGGTLNLGAGGIVYGGGAGTQSILLSGGTLGAQADWSSSLNMTLTNKPGPGTVTFRSADVGGAAHTITLSGVLRGNGGLSKTGSGIVVLDGLNTYTGATVVSEGTLGGTGSIAGTVTVASNAFLAAGDTDSVGTLTVTNLVMQEGAGLTWNFGTASQDRIVVNGALTLATNAVVNISAAEGATLAQLPSPAVLLTYGSSSGAESLSGWTVNGPSSARVLLDAPNKRLLLRTAKGTLIRVL